MKQDEENIQEDPIDIQIENIKNPTYIAWEYIHK